MEKFVFFDSLYAKLPSVSQQDSKRQQDVNEMFQHQNTENLQTACGHCTLNIHNTRSILLTVQPNTASVSLVYENKAPGRVTSDLLNRKENTNKHSLSFYRDEVANKILY